MEDYIEISTLNDFIFCPYSIYLHNVYYCASEDIYQASPQLKGKLAHTSVDNCSSARLAGDLSGLPVFSYQYRLMGKIDVYKAHDSLLIERKQKLPKIYQGQIYQLWAQLLCMIEMGYKVRGIGFYDISTRKIIPVNMPDEDDLIVFENFLERYRQYNPYSDNSFVSEAKCAHCIYCNLCDKTIIENVYSQRH